MIENLPFIRNLQLNLKDMKNIKLVALGFVLIAAFACNDSSKSDEIQTQETEIAETIFSLVKDSTKVKFTAYKTTEKLGVGGEFKTVNITNLSDGATALEALNGANFSIPVSSIFTNDATETRDEKIITFFFQAMNQSEFISGVFNVSPENECTLDVTLNGKTASIPLTYTTNSETSLSFDGVMNLENWDALGAVASLNKACKALHTGADGVSKTWSEVAVHADVLLQKN